MNYRKVNVSERLPEKSDKYLTDIGWIWYDLEYKTWYREHRFEYWYEPIQEITEEELEEILKYYESHSVDRFHEIKIPAIFPRNYKKVAKAIIKLMEEKK